MALIRLGRTLLAILLTLTLLLPGSLVLANPPPLVDVLVTFYQPPGPAESQLIETLGGTVKRVYTLVPTILAAMPEANIITLRSDPRVKSVDSDAIVSLPPDRSGSAVPIVIVAGVPLGKMSGSKETVSPGEAGRLALVIAPRRVQSFEAMPQVETMASSVRSTTNV